MKYYVERKARLIVCEYDNQKFFYETLEDTYDDAARKAVDMYAKEIRNILPVTPDCVYEQIPPINL